MEIKLTKGYVAIVDKKDFYRLNKYKWRVHRNRANSYKGQTSMYAVRWTPRNNYKRTQIYMHWDICGKKHIDHINNNGLDNRRNNLRVCTASQNQANRRVGKPKSGFKGVSVDRRKLKKKFYVRIRKNGKTYTKGMFVSAKEASDAYRKLAIKLFGDFAKWK